jgi:hypothetical protein
MLQCTNQKKENKWSSGDILNLYIILNENSNKKDCMVSSTLYIQEVHS